MDKVRKVYVDSRFRTKDSVSNSDFKVELKEAIDLPENTVCYVDDISIPHSWHTVESGRNNPFTSSQHTLKQTRHLHGGIH